MTVNQSFDDLIFEGRNQSYGAFVLRKKYSKRMSGSMTVGILLFLLIVNIPRIMGLLKTTPAENVPITIKEITLAEPPLMEPIKPPPPKANPPSANRMIKFVPPTVRIDETDPADNEEMPPSVDSLIGKEPGTTDTLIIGNIGNIPVETPPPTSVKPPSEKEKPVIVAEQMPEFPDGEAAMLRYIYANTKYPAIARENGIEGQVVIRFIVSKTGELQNIQVVRAIGGGCEEEAVRVVQSMPKWKPGMQNGRPVPVIFTLPVRFTLR